MIGRYYKLVVHERSYEFSTTRDETFPDENLFYLFLLLIQTFFEQPCARARVVLSLFLSFFAHIYRSEIMPLIKRIICKLFIIEILFKIKQKNFLFYH